VPIEDLELFISQNSDVMIGLLEERYGHLWGNYVKVIYPQNKHNKSINNK
jgi:hypothetical protein